MAFGRASPVMFYPAATYHVISLYFMSMPVADFRELQEILNLLRKQNECWRAPARKRAWSIHN